MVVRSLPTVAYMIDDSKAPNAPYKLIQPVPLSFSLSYQLLRSTSANQPAFPTCKIIITPMKYPRRLYQLVQLAYHIWRSLSTFAGLCEWRGFAIGRKGLHNHKIGSKLILWTLCELESTWRRIPPQLQLRLQSSDSRSSPKNEIYCSSNYQYPARFPWRSTVDIKSTRLNDISGKLSGIWVQ